MQKNLNIDIREFDYPLQDENIAKFPLKNRDEAKLLRLTEEGKLAENYFYELPELLDNDTLLVLNDTKVVYARILFKKDSGSTIEIFCLEPMLPSDIQLSFEQKQTCEWKCFVGNNKRWKSDTISKKIIIEDKEIILSAERKRNYDDSWIVSFSWTGEVTFSEILDKAGEVPLPPYLKRNASEQDKTDYQTVYAHYEGSVAAPTAGLHFTKKTFDDISQRGIDTCFVTLHVGAGTFKPVKENNVLDHVMHTERISIKKDTIEKLLNYSDKKIRCVGTTSVRTIESLYWYGLDLITNAVSPSEYMNISQWEPYKNTSSSVSRTDALTAILEAMDKNKTDCLTGQTQLMIIPSYEYKMTDGMITNFHQPKSTLLLLVSAMIGDQWKKVYNFALSHKYRFLSFGDACMFSKRETK